MKLSQSTIEQTLETDIVDIVKQWVPDLKKSGAGWKAKSPFTDEKTPSFNVSPSKNIFKCFSTGNGGGPVKFVMLKEGLSFPEAVKKVAELAHITIEYDELPANYKEETESRETLFKINQAAAAKYAEQLTAMFDESRKAEFAVHPAVNEIVKRGYDLDTIIQWQLGYAPGDTNGYQPNQWKFITNLVGDKNYAGALEVGLINTNKGHTYDVFRHRLIYPIHDHTGRVVSFGGRALPSLSTGEGRGEASDFVPAKYLNGKDSKIYHKETVLYGLNFAAKKIRACGFAYLTEGYTDVISFHQAGYDCTVGTCGTALTQKQCALLKRYTSKVVIFYDGDDAGQKATLRAIDLLTQEGFETSVVPMPVFDDGRKVDPDDLTRMFKEQLTI